MPESEHLTKKFVHFAALLALMSPLQGQRTATSAETADPVVKIEVHEQSFASLEDVVLFVTITNPAQTPMHLTTGDIDPPVGAVVIGADGRKLILGKVVKRGNSNDPKSWTKIREFTLGPGEVRAYTCRLPDLMPWKGARLGEAKSETVQIHVLMVPLSLVDGNYQTKIVDSNTLHVAIR
jgi:hypothetical protein